MLWSLAWSVSLLRRQYSGGTLYYIYIYIYIYVYIYIYIYVYLLLLLIYIYIILYYIILYHIILYYMYIHYIYIILRASLCRLASPRVRITFPGSIVLCIYIYIYIYISNSKRRKFVPFSVMDLIPPSPLRILTGEGFSRVRIISPGSSVLYVHSFKIVYTSRFVRVILAQGPC